MNTKEAIEIVSVGREELFSIKGANGIVNLLREGEKYKQMWELLEASMEGQFCITPIEIYFKKDSINKQMENIKQKHFPKED